MMMILVPFIAFSMVAALCYTVTHRHKKTNQLDIKNKLFNVMQKDRYEQAKTPISISTRNHQNTKPRAHLELNNGSPTNKPSNTFIDIDETETATHSEHKKQASQMTGETLDPLVADNTYSTVIFNDTELALIRAGYKHRSTGKRKISRRHKSNYITARNGKIYDTRKIIDVMQKKLTNGASKKSYEDNMTLKLQLLQAGIKALMAQDELPKNFVMPDNCTVHRIVKNVTYGELKQTANTKNSSIELEGSGNTEYLSVSTTTQRPKIKALKINYKVKNSTLLKH